MTCSAREDGRQAIVRRLKLTKATERQAGRQLCDQRGSRLRCNEIELGENLLGPAPAWWKYLQMFVSRSLTCGDHALVVGTTNHQVVLLLEAERALNSFDSTLRVKIVARLLELGKC
jgi:hypothetical protein